ncbi:MAG: hypothetical protein ACPGVC_08690 [Salibacteraceae bacterium]
MDNYTKNQLEETHDWTEATYVNVRNMHAEIHELKKMMQTLIYKINELENTISES